MEALKNGTAKNAQLEGVLNRLGDTIKDRPHLKLVPAPDDKHSEAPAPPSVRRSDDGAPVPGPAAAAQAAGARGPQTAGGAIPPLAEGGARRRRRTEKKGHKIQMDDGLYDRLHLYARRQRKNISEVLCELADTHLPRYYVREAA